MVHSHHMHAHTCVEPQHIITGGVNILQRSTCAVVVTALGPKRVGPLQRFHCALVQQN